MGSPLWRLDENVLKFVLFCFVLFWLFWCLFFHGWCRSSKTMPTETRRFRSCTTSSNTAAVLFASSGAPEEEEEEEAEEAEEVTNKQKNTLRFFSLCLPFGKC